jgi:hypothetical protein
MRREEARSWPLPQTVAEHGFSVYGALLGAVPVVQCADAAQGSTQFTHTLAKPVHAFTTHALSSQLQVTAMPVSSALRMLSTADLSWQISDCTPALDDALCADILID